jgi:hypothetical protein
MAASTSNEASIAAVEDATVRLFRVEVPEEELAVRLLPRRPLTEALIEMAEQWVLSRELRHVVVGAA